MPQPDRQPASGRRVADRFDPARYSESGLLLREYQMKPRLRINTGTCRAIRPTLLYPRTPGLIRLFEPPIRSTNPPIKADLVGGVDVAHKHAPLGHPTRLGNGHARQSSS